ncbi:MAG: ATP synthase F0 subunit B [Acidimicrobiales bacterium]
MSDEVPEAPGDGPEDSFEGDGGIESILEELVDIVSTAKSVPLSSSVMVARDEVLDLLEAARDELPEELRRARRLLKDREDVLAAARREAGEIVDDARVQAERMVQRTEIVRQAEHRSLRIVEDAEAESRRLRHEADDYVDRHLARFEIVLDRTMRTVRHGRELLAAVPPETEGDEDDGSLDGKRHLADGEGTAAAEELFDQDTE